MAHERRLYASESIIREADTHIFILLGAFLILERFFQKVALMIPPSWLSNARHHHFAASGVCVYAAAQAAARPCQPSSRTHTCTSVCPWCRLAQVLPLDWLPTCRKLNALASMHYSTFQTKLQDLILTLSVCMLVCHTYLHKKEWFI